MPHGHGKINYLSIFSACPCDILIRQWRSMRLKETESIIRRDPDCSGKLTETV